MRINAQMKTRIAGWFVLGAGIVLMIVGVRNGEIEVVFEKAIDICLQCIGIG